MSYDTFFKLLRLGLWAPTTPEPIAEPIDWPEVIRTAKEQAVVGLLANGAGVLSSVQPIPQDVENQLRTWCLLIMKQNALLDHTVAETVSFFRSHGIEGVLLKGQGVARCYPDPSLRQCGDIDFYVGREQYPKAARVGMEGWSDTGNIRGEIPKHCDFRHGKVTIEIHRKAAELPRRWHNPKFTRWCLQEIPISGSTGRKLTIEGVDVALPSPTFDALFIFLHLYNHFFASGIGLRQLCDWVMVLHSLNAQINRDELGRRLRRFRLFNTWQTFSCIAVDVLGLPADEMPFYAPERRPKAGKVLAKIMRDGNFGENRGEQHSSDESYWQRKRRTLHITTRRLAEAMRYAPIDSSADFLETALEGIRHLFERK